MDICMFLPYQRKELLRLLQEYDAIRKKLVSFLEEIEKEWKDELYRFPQTKDADIYEVMAEERLDILSCWIDSLEKWEIPLRDMEEEGG